MKKREIITTVNGHQTTDGAGVKLVRVLGIKNVEDFDPFLMLDSFDSANPADYTAGFPMHPHRGIETITYLISGKMDHKDSLGNKDTINEGESQWMTAGSGIMHEEMPQASDRMLGFQLWLNLSAEEKMCEPAYLSITKDMMPKLKKDDGDIIIVAGEFEGVQGERTKHIPLTICDVTLPSGGTIEMPTDPENTVFVFLIEGSGVIDGQDIPTKTAVLFDKGEYISVSAPPSSDLRFIYYSAKPLGEPIAWGGPIVMNTPEELELAFSELRKGTFIKHK